MNRQLRYRALSRVNGGRETETDLFAGIRKEALSKDALPRRKTADRENAA